MKKALYAILIFWAFIVSYMVIQNEYTLRHGKEVLLKIVPIDPRDLLRGDYVILNFDISSLPRKDAGYFKSEADVYVSLDVNKKKAAMIKYVTDKKPEKGLFIKGKIKNKRTIIYGIESYFVKENSGKNLEKELSKGAYAVVLIDKNGNAKVKKIVPL